MSLTANTMPDAKADDPLGTVTCAGMAVRAMRRPQKWWGNLVDAMDDSANIPEMAAIPSTLRKEVRRKFRSDIVARTTAERQRVATVILEAKRFHLGGEFFEMVSNSQLYRDPGEIVGLVEMARLPFPTLWLEFRYRAPAEYWGGILLERFSADDPTRWVAQIFSVTREGMLIVSGCGFAISTTGEPLGDLPSSFQRFSPDFRGVPHHYAYAGFGRVSTVAPGKVYVCPEGYEDAVCVTGSPLFERAFGDVLPSTSAAEVMARSRETMDEIDRRAGQLRLCLGLLATLNHLEYDIVDTGPSAPRLAGADRSLPVATIVLRPDRTVAKNENGNPFDEGIRRRLHDVRGHWRHYRNPDGSVRKRIWIDTYERGDGLTKLQRDYATQDSEHRAVSIADEAPLSPQDEHLTARPSLVERVANSVRRLLRRKDP